MSWASRLIRALDAFAAASATSLVAIGATLVWLVSGYFSHFSATWVYVMSTTSAVVTFVMVFVIANAQKRNTAALHLKIDMLVAAHPELSNRAVGVEHKPDHHIEEMRDELAAHVSQADGKD